MDDVKQVSGGSLFCDQSEENRIHFLPNGVDDFEVALSFLVPVGEDTGSRLISFQIPPALRNTLLFDLDKDLLPVEVPGIADAHGGLHFSTRSRLTIRFSEKQALARIPVANVDLQDYAERIEALTEKVQALRRFL